MARRGKKKRKKLAESRANKKAKRLKRKAVREKEAKRKGSGKPTSLHDAMATNAAVVGSMLFGGE